jgi:hypothetical protein
MAEIFPTEGLDMVIAILPKNGANVASTYIGLWGTNFTASTVGTASNPRASYTEPSGGAYARQTIAAASWGANADGGGGASEPGRKTTAGQVTFPTATAVWGTINGFYLVSSATAGQGSLWFACNFDDTTAITVNTNDIVKVTPTWELRN